VSIIIENADAKAYHDRKIHFLQILARFICSISNKNYNFCFSGFIGEDYMSFILENIYIRYTDKIKVLIHNII
jgi:hypothetical protein